MRVAIVCFRKDREKLLSIAEFLSQYYDVEIVFYQDDWEQLFEYDCIIAYLASGIVVRKIAPHLKSKWEDPAVVVLDKPLKHAFVLLGGHHGGNEVAKKLEALGIEAILTTAMEYEDGFSVGVGFRKDVGAEEIIDAIMNALKIANIKLDEVRLISTVEGKEGSVIVEVADKLKRPLIFVKKRELNSLNIRETKAKIIGVKNVAEGCALLTSKFGELILPKTVFGGVTVAIAR